MDDAAAIRKTVHLLFRRHRIKCCPSELMDDPSESVLHVFRLLDLVIRPLPVKAKHRDSILVHDAGIDLAVAIVICDHLAAAREGDDGSPELAVVGFETFSIASHAVVAFDVAHESGCGRPTSSAAELDMVAPREVELLIVEP